MTAAPPGGELAARIGRLADQLTATGALTQPHWRQALHVVPRHLFVPAVAWAEDAPVDREADPQSWLEAVYSDIPLITQIDDGIADVRAGHGLYTSSCSAPGAVIDYLERLGPQPGDRVLEIGTGTGWTAALLSWRAGQENVTSIEIDPEIAAQAAANLKAAGYAPRLIIGDGETGWPDGAPYDRVHATCAAQHVPYEWVEQCRPGGVIVTPFQPTFGNEGLLARLHVLADGTATGDFPAGAAYMMLRAQRLPYLGSEAWTVHNPGNAPRETTRINPRLLTDPGPGAALMLSALAPGVMAMSDDDGLWLLDAAGPGSSWAVARLDRDDDGSFGVWQHGPRRLWNETENAYLRWLALGASGTDRFGLTVGSSGQQLWLNDPGNVLRGTTLQ